jgi:molecular chaperone DnaK
MIHLGIDLGTTNTVLAMGREIIAASAAGPVLPSVVAFPPSGEVVVGQDARRRRAIDTPNTIHSAKRLIGRKWFAIERAEFQRCYPAFALKELPGGLVGFETRRGLVGPVDIAAHILTAACSYAKIQPKRIALAITVPAKFGPEQRAATAEAATRAGFETVHVLDEPMATALAYGSRAPVKTAVVYDFGGGTFDVAVIDCTTTPYKVLAKDGDPFLGGDDIDRRLAQYCADKALREHGIELHNDPVLFYSLMDECERAKIRLSHQEDTAVDLRLLIPTAPDTAKIPLRRKVLAALMADLLQRTFLICDEVLRRAGKKTGDIDGVFLAGGTSSLPFVWEGVGQFFGQTPRCEFSPIEVVGIGASLAGAMLE